MARCDPLLRPSHEGSFGFAGTPPRRVSRRHPPHPSRSVSYPLPVLAPELECPGPQGVGEEHLRTGGFQDACCQNTHRARISTPTRIHTGHITNHQNICLPHPTESARIEAGLAFTGNGSPGRPLHPSAARRARSAAQRGRTATSTKATTYYHLIGVLTLVLWPTCPVALCPWEDRLGRSAPFGVVKPINRELRTPKKDLRPKDIAQGAYCLVRG